MNMSLVSLVSLFHEIRTRSATGWPSCSKILAFRPKNRFLHSNHRCLFPALLPRRFVSNQGNRRSLFATSLGLLVSFTIGASIAQVSASDGRRESVSVLDSVCKRKFTVIAAPGMEASAMQLVSSQPDRFKYCSTKWSKFPDGSDHIELGGFQPENRVKEHNVLFLASFHNNDITLSQYHALITLCESFVESLTILLPYLPTATMERTTKEGEVATANSSAKLLSNLPNVGKPIRVMMYDLHTLQNRFYFCNNALPSMHSTFPLLIDMIADPRNKIEAVCFPDDGAYKRYAGLLKQSFPQMEMIVCAKHRVESDPTLRRVVIGDGDPRAKNVVICDDLVRSGGTLVESAKALKAAGARDVSLFVAHAAFETPTAHQRFCRGGADAGLFRRFYVTSTNPTVTDRLPRDDVFQVLDFTKLVLRDLD